MRVCHMQQDHSRGIMAEIQVYATVAQARLFTAACAQRCDCTGV